MTIIMIIMVMMVVMVMWNTMVEDHPGRRSYWWWSCPRRCRCPGWWQQRWHDDRLFVCWRWRGEWKYLELAWRRLSTARLTLDPRTVTPTWINDDRDDDEIKRKKSVKTFGQIQLTNYYESFYVPQVTVKLQPDNQNWYWIRLCRWNWRKISE